MTFAIPRSPETRTPRRRNDRGVILLIVLWAVAMMSVIVVALGSLAQKSLVGEGAEAQRMQSTLALQAGIELGKAFILSLTPDQRVFLDGTTFSSVIGEDGSVAVSVRDATGLVDINRADLKLVEAAATAAGLDAIGAATVSSVIGDLRKSASDAKKTEGTANTTATQDSTDDAKNLPLIFVSPAQLRGLVDVPDSITAKLLSLVGLYSATGMVNPLAAPETLLRAIPGITAKDVSTVLAAKKTRQWKNDQRMGELLDRLKDFFAVEEPRVFLIEATLRQGRGLIARSKLGAVVMLGEGPGLPFRTLALSW